MGTNQNTYIGPYITIDKLPTKSKNETLYTCSNTSCKIRGRKAIGKFCNDCGSENTNVTKTKEVNISPYELMNEFGNEDIMFNLEGEYLLPNSRNKYSIRYDDNDGFLKKDIMDKSLAINAFSTEHKDFIDFLISKDVQFTISFGVIAYYW